MAAACALAIFSGKSIIHFGIAERLRTLRYSLFMEGIVKDNGSYSARFFQKQSRCKKQAPVWA